jgi:hypothetical protein
MAGAEVRKYTLYADNDPYANRRKHTDEWFAVLFQMAARLRECLPQLFHSHQDAVEFALLRDRFDESMTDVPWVR